METSYTPLIQAAIILSLTVALGILGRSAEGAIGGVAALMMIIGGCTAILLAKSYQKPGENNQSDKEKYEN